jgi:hypothetical protein
MPSGLLRQAVVDSCGPGHSPEKRMGPARSGRRKVRACVADLVANLSVEGGRPGHMLRLADVDGTSPSRVNMQKLVTGIVSVRAGTP